MSQQAKQHTWQKLNDDVRTTADHLIVQATDNAMNGVNEVHSPCMLKITEHCNKEVVHHVKAVETNNQAVVSCEPQLPYSATLTHNANYVH